MNNKYELLGESEQKNIFAGLANVDMSPIYLTKSACEIKATTLVVSGKVKYMTILAVAQELFAHACCFYGAATVKALGVESAIVDDIYSRAERVDIADGGDSPDRIATYILIWKLAPNIIAP